MRTKKQLSAAVNSHLSESSSPVARERRLQMLGEAVSDYEKAFGEITAAELVAQEQADRQNSIKVRPRRRSKST